MKSSICKLIHKSCYENMLKNKSVSIVTILLALSFLRGTAGGGSSVAPPPPAPVPRSSTPFCRLLSFGGSSGGLSSASFGGLAPGTRVSSLSNMASRSGPWSSNLGLPSSSGLSSFGNCGNGYRLHNNNSHFDMTYLVF